MILGSRRTVLMLALCQALAMTGASIVATTASIAGMVGYGVMSLVMTATPIAILDCGHAFGDAAFALCRTIGSGADWIVA